MSIILTSRSGPDGKLHIEIPVQIQNAEFEIEVVVRPKSSVRTLPPGYFDLLGSVDDETLVRPPQPPMPSAVELE